MVVPGRTPCDSREGQHRLQASQDTSYSRSSITSGLGSLILQGLGFSSSSENSASLTATLSRSLSETDSYLTTTIPPATLIYNATSAVLSTSPLYGNSTIGPGPAISTRNGTYTVERIGSGLKYASACDDEWVAYADRSTNAAYLTTVSTSSLTTAFFATIKTVCGGLASVLGDLTPTKSGYAHYTTEIVVTEYNSPEPSCKINNDDCNHLSSLSSSLSDSFIEAYSSVGTTVTFADPLTFLIAGNDVGGWSTASFTDTSPTLTVNGSVLTADAQGAYAFTAYPEPNLNPGESVTSLTPGGTYYFYGPTPTWSDFLTVNCLPTSGPSCGSCTVHGDHVQLFYFPAKATTSKDLCTYQGDTYATGTRCPWGSPLDPNPENNIPFCQGCKYDQYNISSSTPDSGPHIVSDGLTFYADRVYISLSSVSASNSCTRVGSVHTSLLLTVASSDILTWGSARQYGYAALGYPFNFDDLNPPIARTAFNLYPCPELNQCNNVLCNRDTINNISVAALGGYCSVLVDKAFEPLLAIPPQLRGLDPAWASCGLGLEGLYDPPKALTPATTIEGPLVPSPTSASPASRPASVTPSPTSGTDMATANNDPVPESSPQNPDSVASTLGPPPPSSASSAAPTSLSPSPSDQTSDLSDPFDNESTEPTAAVDPPQSPTTTRVDHDGNTEPGLSTANDSENSYEPVGRPLPGDTTTMVIAPTTQATTGQSSAIAIAGTTNALTILSQAMSSGSSGVDSQIDGAGADDNNGDQANENVPQPTLQIVATGANGQAITIQRQGVSAVIAGGGSETTVALGLMVTMLGNTISLLGDGNAAVLGAPTMMFSTSHADSADSLTMSHAVLYGQDGSPVTAIRDGSAVIVAAGTRSTVVALGSAATVNGEIASVPSNGGEVVLGSKTASFSTAGGDAFVAATFTDRAGSTDSILRQGSSLLVLAGDRTVALFAGTQTINGVTISLPSGDAATNVVVDGTTIPVSPATAARYATSGGNGIAEDTPTSSVGTDQPGAIATSSAKLTLSRVQSLWALMMTASLLGVAMLI
ncbi:hypothetical protein LTR27_008932 [Elasticomyces elasticus]|nr:hypothetical protein LTR27_008932 [Elasticomyces elasticus]